MKKLKTLVIILICVIGFNIPEVKAENIEIYSETAVLYNLNEDKILFEKNKDKEVSIASLTKMMTALVAIENIENLNEKVTFQKSDYENLIAIDASSSSLDKTKSYTYYDLLYGLMLESGADCANALARLTAGNKEEFVKLMNEKAKNLGMNNTSFENPIGMDHKNNYSTMNDLSILFKTGLKNPEFEKIITTFKYKLSDGNTINHTINGYLRYADFKLPYLKGGKTGYEIDAGYALATIAEKNDVTLMFITSKAKNTPNQFKDAKKVYDHFFNNYSYQTMLEKDELITTLKADYLNIPEYEIKAPDRVTYYMENKFKGEDIKIIYDGTQKITLKNKYQEKLGDIKVYYKNELVRTVPVTLNEKIYPDYKLIVTAVAAYTMIIGTTILIIRRIRTNTI